MNHIPSLQSSFRDAARIAAAYFRSEERRSATALLAGAIAVQLVLVGTAVATNYWRNAFFQTLQDRDWAGFMTQFGVYCAIGVFFVLATVYQRYLTQWLTIRWRRWLTTHYLERWLNGPVHYRAMITGGDVDNPDQRIAEDVRQFIDDALSLAVGLIGAIARLFSFVAVLWTLSSLVPLQLLGTAYAVPGYLVWAALLYALVGSIVTHWIGRRLIPTDFEQQRREANFRFALVRVRENSEAVALLRGEASERHQLLALFSEIAQNWYRLMRWQQFVLLFATTYRHFSLYFPYLVASPLFFAGSMQFGALMQSGSAFNEVRDAFSYFISSYLKIAELAATVQRLSQFERAIAAAERSGQPASPPAKEALLVRDLAVNDQAGRPIAGLKELALAAGEAVLLTGASGAGKTSLLRRLAGIWPRASGTVAHASDHLLALPQRPYIPLGSLRRALSYPAPAGAIGDKHLHEALDAVGLSRLKPCLDVAEAWDKVLSEGEKQRLSLARALLVAPDLLLLDEATSAIDEQGARALHRMIRRRLSRAAVLSATHDEALRDIYDRSIAI